MTLKLILMRHAKSDWTDPFQDDHDRVLNPRGRRSAAALGKWLAETGHVPGQVLCSTSTRTRETWSLVNEVLNCKAVTFFQRDLYLASSQEMLHWLRNLGTAQTVLLIAHNPGTGQMAEMLISSAAPDGNFRRYPTGYTAVIEFDAEEWKQVDWGQGALTAHVGPRSLIAPDT